MSVGAAGVRDRRHPDDDRPPPHDGAALPRPGCRGESRGGGSPPRLRSLPPGRRRVHRQPPAPAVRWSAACALNFGVATHRSGQDRRVPVHVGDAHDHRSARGAGSRRCASRRPSTRQSGREPARPSCSPSDSPSSAVQGAGVPAPSTASSLTRVDTRSSSAASLPSCALPAYLARPHRSSTATAGGRSPGSISCSSRSTSSWRSPAGRDTPPTPNGPATPSDATSCRTPDVGCSSTPIRQVTGQRELVARTMRERLIAAGWSALSSPDSWGGPRIP